MRTAGNWKWMLPCLRLQYRNALPGGTCTSTVNTTPLLITELAGGSISLQRHEKHTFLDAVPYHWSRCAADTSTLILHWFTNLSIYSTSHLNYCILHVQSHLPKKHCIHLTKAYLSNAYLLIFVLYLWIFSSVGQTVLYEDLQRLLMFYEDL